MNYIDKGFCLEYKKLSYRRRWIRNLWFMVPGSFIFYLFPKDLFEFLSEATGISIISKHMVVSFFICIFALAAIYNFYMWKKTAQKKNWD